MPRKRVSQTSLEYWKKREDEARKLYQEQEQNYDQEISRIYNRMLQDVQLQINGFFGRYAKSEGISIADAKARASAMDVASFAEKAKKYVQARDFSKEANEALKLYNLTMKVNRLELLKANIGLEMCSGFDEMQKYFEQIMIERVQDECERQSGILGQTVKSNAKMAKSLVGASFNNATFSDRIWMYQGMLRSELSSLLEQGVVQGKHANELAKHLEKRFGTSKFNAQRLMRTEMARVQTEAQKQSLEQTGYDEYIFIAEHDARTCRACGWLDGRTYKLSEMMPGTNAAPIHPMCRCSIAAYMDRSQFEKMVARSQAKQQEENIPDKRNSSKPNKKEKTETKGVSAIIKKAINSGEISQEELKELAGDILKEKGISDIPINIKPLMNRGECHLNIVDGKLDVLDYNLDGNDDRLVEYRIKTAFHEAYHASANNLPTDVMKNQRNWLQVEETLAECAAHFESKQYGIVDVTPAYADKLVSMLPKLKKLPEFKGCSKISEFGRVAEDLRERNGSCWNDLYKKANRKKFSYGEYIKQYIPEIRENVEWYVDKYLENSPYLLEYRDNMIKDLNKSMDAIERFGHTTNDNQRTLLETSVAICFERIGVL